MPEAQTTEADDFAIVADYWLAKRGGSKYLLSADRAKIHHWVKECRAYGVPMRKILQGIDDGIAVARELRRAIYGFGWFDVHIEKRVQEFIDARHM